MKEIIVIRTSDSDGSVFRSILGALRGKDVQIVHAADFEPSTLTLGDIEIFPEQRRVTKAGVEICLNYGEFVDNTIWRLRNKLEPDPKHPTYIKTVFRVGYKIEK